MLLQDTEMEKEQHMLRLAIAVDYIQEGKLLKKKR